LVFAARRGVVADSAGGALPGHRAGVKFDFNHSVRVQNDVLRISTGSHARGGRRVSRIRRAELFEAYGRDASYNVNHPDESAPGHFPLVLVCDSVTVGTIRIDMGDPFVFLRMVAVRRDVQRRGAGREMLRLTEAFVRRAGKRDVRLQSHPDAVAFYERCGYSRAVDVAPIGIGVPMGKHLVDE
jgi:GNAT superfamily N-acetyltransferase